MDLHERMLNEGDVEALQALLESQPAYAERLTGYPPGPSDALSALIGVPPGLDRDHKRAVGLWNRDTLVAFADVLVGYPDSRTAYLGLLLVHGRYERRGFGGRLHQVLDAHLAEEPGVTRVRLGLVSPAADASTPFWRAMGYRITDERKPYRYGHVQGTTTIWERGMTQTPPWG